MKKMMGKNLKIELINKRNNLNEFKKNNLKVY